MKRILITISLALTIILPSYAAEENWAATKFQAVKKMIDAKNYEAAELVLKAVLEQDADNAEAYYYLGLSKEKQKTIDEALQNYEQCRRLNLAKEMSLEDRQVYEKATAAVKKLDKAMPIALKAAETMERKAKYMEKKDPYASKKLLELAAGLRAPWSDSPVEMVKDKDDTKEDIRKRADEFFKCLVDGNLSKAQSYFDPDFKKKRGSAAVVAKLNVWANSIGGKWKKKPKVTAGKIKIGEDKETAEVTPINDKGEKGKPMNWIRRDRKWYVSGE